MPVIPQRIGESLIVIEGASPKIVGRANLEYWATDQLQKKDARRGYREANICDFQGY